MDDPSQTGPYSAPGEVVAEDGFVLLDGPDGVAMTLTAQAAVEWGERLVSAGKEALTQKGTAPET